MRRERHDGGATRVRCARAGWTGGREGGLVDCMVLRDLREEGGDKGLRGRHDGCAGGRGGGSVGETDGGQDEDDEGVGFGKVHGENCLQVTEQSMKRFLYCVLIAV